MTLGPAYGEGGGSLPTDPTITDFSNAVHDHVDPAGGGVLSHFDLDDIGSNAHSVIDTHLAATAAHGATGAVVGTTNSQTLANKTLTTPTILSAGFTNMQHDHDGATEGGQLYIVMEDTLEWAGRDFNGFSPPYGSSAGTLWGQFAVASDKLRCMWKIPSDIDVTFDPIVTLTMIVRATESTGDYGLRVTLRVGAIQTDQVVSTVTSTTATEIAITDPVLDEPHRLTWTLDDTDHLITGSPWALAVEFNRDAAVVDTELGTDPAVITASIKYRIKVSA